MATSPMDAANDPSYGAEQDNPGAASDAPKYVVEIACMPDGTFMVSVEGGDEEAEEEGGEDQGGAPTNAMGGSDDGEQGEAQEPAGMPARTKKEALTLALDIINAGGKMPGGADDSFQAGFSGGQ